MFARLRAGGHPAARFVFGGFGAALFTAVLVGGALPASAVTPPVLEKIKQCESGGNYRAVNPESGASGAYQFLDSTWRAMPQSPGYAKASYAPPTVQDGAAQTLYAQQGTAPWNASKACWSRAAKVPSIAPAKTTPVTKSLRPTKSHATHHHHRYHANHHHRYHANHHHYRYHGYKNYGYAA